jgi:hypothetical protein
MTTLTAAVVREQGVTFAVAIMKDHVLNSPMVADQQIRAVALALGCPLVVLMGETNRRLRGNRQDVVNFVSRLHPSQLPWKKYHV